METLEATPETTEANKQVVLAYVEAFNQADMPALRRIFADDALVYGVLGWGTMDQVIPVWQELHAAFALQLHVEAIAADGDNVMVRYLERGQSVGSFRGGPVTGKPYEIVAMEHFVVRGGRIQRRWGARDSAAMNRQMGLPLS
ncbi:ester cyclase [Hymenobacter latericus]|uniref:ester cyclase n=1 Tax=Hymenobacter sp. YIM 151858-1 TaxID=2987688 RepID=UPI0022273AE5|nr:ester cyclase [Hymenobacter sp. YIM 151858-1]UYZ58488.1 ester cyclase [Hymenobacter sp. YIM 151858-1]